MSEPPVSNPNRVRDHLANERTFLAWVRTAVALMGFGMVIARLRFFLPAGSGPGHGWELGVVFAAMGLVTVVLSTLHYLSVGRAIEAQSYRPSGQRLVLFSVAIALIGAAVLIWLLTSPTPPAGVPSVE